MANTSLNRNTCLALKGSFALIILLHHFTTSLSGVPLWFEWMKYIAFPLVGAYFFLSGYGLTSSLLNKKDYLRGFLTKRFTRVLIPFICVAGAATLVLSLITKSFINAFSIGVVLQYWFIYVILAAYLVFFCVFRFFSVKRGAWLILGLVLFYTALSIFVNPLRNEMYASVIAFPLGILFKNYEKEISAFYAEGFFIKFILQALLCFGLFAVRLFLAYRGFLQPVFHTVMRNLITALFVWLVALSAQRTEIRSKPLLRLGRCSYEIYIIHPILIKLYLLFRVPNGTGALLLMVAVVVTATLALSLAANILFSKINFNGGNKNVKKT